MASSAQGPINIALLTTKFSFSPVKSVCKWGRGEMAKRGDFEGRGNRTSFTCIFYTVSHVYVAQFIEKP